MEGKEKGGERECNNGTKRMRAEKKVILFTKTKVMHAHSFVCGNYS